MTFADFFLSNFWGTGTNVSGTPAPAPPPKIPNVGDREDMATLQDEYKFNPTKVEKIKELGKDYTHWRSIRGDGNCFYRAVMFGVLEAILERGDRARWEELVMMLTCEVSFEDAGQQAAHMGLVQKLRQFSTPEQLEQRVLQQDCFDKALIRAARRLTRIFLTDNGDTVSRMAGVEHRLVAEARFGSMDNFLSQVVDGMGASAESPACEALAAKLGVGLRTCWLDFKAKIPLFHLDQPNQKGCVDVHVLLRPGHYDLLYSKNRPPKADMTPLEPPSLIDL